LFGQLVDERERERVLGRIEVRRVVCVGSFVILIPLRELAASYRVEFIQVVTSLERGVVAKGHAPKLACKLLPLKLGAHRVLGYVHQPVEGDFGNRALVGGVQILPHPLLR
jgi:hypothetical protein